VAEAEDQEAVEEEGSHPRIEVEVDLPLSTC